MPDLHPFRGLRYGLARVGDLSDVLCPPYDVISAEERRELLARDAHNAVRLELPSARDDVADAGGSYRSAARTLEAWRADRTLEQDPDPCVYVHDMRYVTMGGEHRTARGVICRLELEPLGPSSGVRPHERTMEAPKEDRFRLLAATGANLSPVVLIHDRSGTRSTLDRLTADAATAEATDSAGIEHRLWVVPFGPASDEVVPLLDAFGSGPLTIADGHHRYETALRYRDECASARAASGLPRADTVMALIYSTEEAPSVLATHRVVSAVPSDLLARAGRLFDIQRVDDAHSLLRLMAEPPGPGKRSRFGCWTDEGGALLMARSSSEEVDAALLGQALRYLVGIDEDELRAGGRVAYTKDPDEAIALVEGREGDAAFLLDATPLEAVLRVAGRGGIMPQKSTYFQPKAPTGLVFDPLHS